MKAQCALCRTRLGNDPVKYFGAHNPSRGMKGPLNNAQNFILTALNDARDERNINGPCRDFPSVAVQCRSIESGDVATIDRARLESPYTNSPRSI